MHSRLVFFISFLTAISILSAPGTVYAKNSQLSPYVDTFQREGSDSSKKILRDDSFRSPPKAHQGSQHIAIF